MSLLAALSLCVALSGCLSLTIAASISTRDDIDNVESTTSVTQIAIASIVAIVVMSVPIGWYWKRYRLRQLERIIAAEGPFTFKGKGRATYSAPSVTNKPIPPAAPPSEPEDQESSPPPSPLPGTHGTRHCASPSSRSSISTNTRPSHDGERPIPRAQTPPNVHEVPDDLANPDPDCEKALPSADSPEPEKASVTRREDAHMPDDDESVFADARSTLPPSYRTAPSANGFLIYPSTPRGPRPIPEPIPMLPPLYTPRDTNAPRVRVEKKGDRDGGLHLVGGAVPEDVEGVEE
ncbi:uncharacterized protein BXZ73DRAFT_77006 [Epithele typhae]|uniref:uncharacterized protein n=1 Tax=Epithele typhae TaxID=378194 RepID=UPI0020082D3E|nr:uncharacterized protein BXZ73DRAFT_77006 [Epithele typhae]KAH9934523.1 hypothetical protein BXZ73DRAFT_77006 [Epithele typhae]